MKDAALTPRVRVILAVLLSASVLATCLWALLNPPPVETPQETQAREDAQINHARIQGEKAERKIYLCHLKSVCAKYNSARQECATAGNFANCISVKIGDRDSSLVAQCTNEGNLSYIPADLPNSVECLYWQLRLR
jgi:hypothetical protein